MRIKLLTSMASQYASYEFGQIVEMEDKEAEGLIRKGYAEKPETATMKGREKATRPAQGHKEARTKTTRPARGPKKKR